MNRHLFAALAMISAAPLCAAAQNTPRYDRADSLRGGNGPARAWWDAVFYDLHVRVNPADSSIQGWNGITYRVLQPSREMQIDLQVPLVIDSIVQDRRRLAFRRDSNAFFVTLPSAPRAGEVKTITVWYHGKPRPAVRAPWDGGYSWARDSTTGSPWIATSNEGLGASVWWPNKDLEGDEPDSQRIAITVPDPLINVSNGRLRNTIRNNDGTTTYEWFVSSPINNYNVAVNAARYAHFSDTMQGERGVLTLDFYPLEANLAAARRQFTQAKPMLRCFESWFGPYPWYEDGYKMVETPHLGMEHQSAIAYGNWYLQGYRGRDLSGTGLGLMWDYIIIHEAAHEWWGNNVSAADHADMWIHESFGYYAEAIYVECTQSRTAGAAYIIGSRRGIQNRQPIVPQIDGRIAYGVNARGSGDMYPKGGNMLHTIRTVLNDDARWRHILRGIQQTFGRRTSAGQDVREYMSREAGIDLSRIFQQYLDNPQLPEFQYRFGDGRLEYRWASVVPGFDMPLDVQIAGMGSMRLRPTESWQSLPTTSPRATALLVDENYYVTSRDMGGAPRN